jgi:hypothetical protein
MKEEGKNIMKGMKRCIVVEHKKGMTTIEAVSCLIFSSTENDDDSVLSGVKQQLKEITVTHIERKRSYRSIQYCTHISMANRVSYEDIK